MGQKPTRSNKGDSITNRSSKEATVENKTFKVKAGMNLWITNKAGLSGWFVIEKLETRQLLKLLRTEKFLSEDSKGKVSVDVLEENSLVLVSHKDNEIVVEVMESEVEEDYIEAPVNYVTQHNYGLTSNFGIVTTREIYAVDNSWVGDDEENDFGEESFAVDQGAFLLKEEKRLNRITTKDLIKARRVLADQAKDANQKIMISKLDPEIIRLMASQIIDSETTPSTPSTDGTFGGDDKIVISIQRLSNKGMWFNLKHQELNVITKKMEDVKSTIEVDMDVIFDLNEYGEPEFLKRKVIRVDESLNKDTGEKTRSLVYGKEVLYDIMRQSGFPLVHSYNYVDEKTGELTFKSQQQRYILKGVALRAGVTIEGKRLESTPSPTFASIVKPKKLFYKKLKGNKLPVKCIAITTDGVTEYVPFNKHTMEVTSSNPAFFNYDNTVALRSHEKSDVDIVIVIPSTEDETHGDAGDKLFDKGIQTGTCVATPAMMSDDMTKQVIEENESERLYLQYIKVKERRYANFAKDTYEYMAGTELGQRVLAMIPLTYQAEEDAFLQADIFTEIKTWSDDAEDILKFLTAVRENEGTAFAYPSWKALNSIAKDKKQTKESKEIEAKNRKFAKGVSAHIIANIAKINNGTVTIDRLDDEEVMAIREASLNFGKFNKACWITDKNVSNALKDRYALITKIKGDKPKVQKFSAPRKLNEKELKEEQRKLKRAK